MSATNEEAGWGSVVSSGLFAAGRAIGRAAVFTGRSVASAYHAIDPDVRRHVAQWPLLSVSLLVPRQRAIEPLVDDGHAPVLFVHGLGGNRGAFVGMQAWFRLSGRTRCYSLGFPSDTTLEERALVVRRTLVEIAEVNALGDAPQGIDVVAHSMGGLIVRLALDDEATCARVRTFVTLGTPHAGTFAARFGATPEMRALRPDSETMRSLRRQLPWQGPPTHPRLVCLWSSADVLLLPPESARMEGAENIEMVDFTHYSYLIHPGAGDTVLKVLAGQ
jgi:triacylglycerol esterase/lipase EstA (alpha/beta hydrolase family)